MQIKTTNPATRIRPDIPDTNSVTSLYMRTNSKLWFGVIFPTSFRWSQNRSNSDQSHPQTFSGRPFQYLSLTPPGHQCFRNRPYPHLFLTENSLLSILRMLNIQSPKIHLNEFQHTWRSWVLWVQTPSLMEKHIRKCRPTLFERVRTRTNFLGQIYVTWRCVIKSIDSSVRPNWVADVGNTTNRSGNLCCTW